MQAVDSLPPMSVSDHSTPPPPRAAKTQLLHCVFSLPLQVLEQAVEVTAQGGTTPAASLWPFYEKKEKVKTFIMVTDEEENGRVQNMW